MISILDLVLQGSSGNCLTGLVLPSFMAVACQVRKSDWGTDRTYYTVRGKGKNSAHRMDLNRRKAKAVF